MASDPTEIRKNSTEVIRVERMRYRGRDVIDVRTYAELASGELRPTHKGVSMATATWPAVVAAIQKALEGPVPDQDAAADGQ